MRYLYIFCLLYFALIYKIPAQSPDRNVGGINPEPECSECRTALVIGISKYKNLPSLKNPENDAKDIAKSLEDAGFEVHRLLGPNHEEILKAFRQFGEDLEKGGVGLFYYSGHGMQIDGSNYLIPPDAEITNQHSVEFEAVDVGRVLAEMHPKDNSRLNILILDACRDNPFKSIRTAYGNGLAAIKAPSGTLISYAAAPGSVALDGDGKNSPFTEALKREIETPGLRIEDIFKNVRKIVKRKTNGLQIPWESTSLENDFYFKPPLHIGSNMDKSYQRLLFKEYELGKQLEAINTKKPEKMPSILYPVAGVIMTTLGAIQLTSLPPASDLEDENFFENEKSRNEKIGLGGLLVGLGIVSTSGYFFEKNKKAKLRAEKVEINRELSFIRAKMEKH